MSPSILICLMYGAAVATVGTLVFRHAKRARRLEAARRAIGAGNPVPAAYPCPGAQHQHLTRSTIWTARVDRQLAPPRLSDYAAAQAYLKAAAHYHRSAMRHPSTPVAFTAAADTLAATTTAPTEARQC